MSTTGSDRIIEIVICTYNGAKFLASQLDSIAKQSHQPDVISIYDDKSTDNSLIIAESYRVLFESFGIEYQVTQNKINIGYSENFAQAVRKSKCEFIFFCDQDDLWSPSKIAVIFQKFQDNTVDLIFSDGFVVDEFGMSKVSHSVLESYQLSANKIENFNKKPMQYLVRRNYVNGCAAAIRQCAALQAGPPPQGMPHDYWFTLWSALHGGVICLPNRLYEYRQHDNNAIGIGRNNLFHQLLAIFRSPRGPRERELRILNSAFARLNLIDNPDVNLLREKLNWMNNIINESSRLLRFTRILLTLIQGKYRTFGQPYSLLRDLVSCIKY